MLQPVEFKLMWEKRNKPNQIFNPTPKDDPVDADADPNAKGETYGAPRYKLYSVVDPILDKHLISLEVEVPPSLRERFVAAVWANGLKVLESDALFPADPNSPVELEINQLDLLVLQDFQVRVGFDANDNQLLDLEEAIKLTITDELGNTIRTEDGETNAEPTVVGISESGYTNAQDSLDAWIIENILATSVLPHAARMLRIFRDDSFVALPQEKQPSSTNVQSIDVFEPATAFSEWLTHNSGILMNEEGVATTLKEYVWEADKSLADLVSNAPPLKIDGLLFSPHDKMNQFFVENVLAAASQHFQNEPLGSTATFPLPSAAEPFYTIAVYPHVPSWVVPTTIEVSPGPLPFLDDANGSVGRARLVSSNYQFNCTKVDLGGNPSVRIDSIRVLGELEDLYDFNIETGGAGAWAATLQIGHGRGVTGMARNSGVVYRSRIRFDSIYTIAPVIHPLQ
jgi:hypothetical protein